MNPHVQYLCIDTGGPSGLARSWQSALGRRRTHQREGEAVLEPPAGSSEGGVAPDPLFLRVPEEKAGKNRRHPDLRPRRVSTRHRS